MLGWAATFLAIALTAGVFSLAPSPSAEAARLVFLVFAALFAIVLILQGLRGPPRQAAPLRDHR